MNDTTKIEVCHRGGLGTYGWFIRHADGFESAMPDEATARLLASAPALKMACETAEQFLAKLPADADEEWRYDLPDTLHALQKAIAASKVN